MVAVPGDDLSERVATAGETLKKIKEIQQDHADRLEAAEELAAQLDGTDLDNRLTAKDLRDAPHMTADAVLAELRAEPSESTDANPGDKDSKESSPKPEAPTRKNPPEAK